MVWLPVGLILLIGTWTCWDTWKRHRRFLQQVQELDQSLENAKAAFGNSSAVEDEFWSRHG